MASITQITTIDGTTYDIRDAQARMYGVHYVEGNTNDTAGTWTGTLENLTAYYNGLTVIYVPKVAGASTTTLNLNNIGAITCYTTNTTKLDTQYTANTPILFTYQDGYWRRADNDVNTTTISNLYHHFGNYVADSAIHRYQILFEKNEDKLTPLTNANNDTGTSKAMLTNVEFNAFGRIFYYVSATDVEANGSVSAGSLCFAHESFNARYTFNCGTTLTAHKNFYLVVTPTSGNLCEIASSSPWAQELPSTKDGYWYILIGRAYSTYQVSLYPLHPVYMHDGTKVIQVMPNGFTASAMVGATSSTDGVSGLVPKPVSGDQTKYLRGDGTWQTVSGGGTIIDDTASYGVTDKTWSANKLATDINGKAESYNTVLTTTLSRGRETNSTSGTGSFAFGNDVIASGSYSFAIGTETEASAENAHSEGSNTTASGNDSHAEGVSTTASATGSHAEGMSTTASHTYAHAEGMSTTASGVGSHAEGSSTTASASCCHAEGRSTEASGNYSHAEGNTTHAEEESSHAEGKTTYARGIASHAEGKETFAVGAYVHAEGEATIGYGQASHVGGRFNVTDTYMGWAQWQANTLYAVGDKVRILEDNKNVGYICTTPNSDAEFTAENWRKDERMNYAEIIGNGANNAGRSNARALTWEGDERLMGDVYIGCNADSTGGIKLTPGVQPFTIQLDTVDVPSSPYNYTHTTQNAYVTSEMKPIQIEYSNPSIFRQDVEILTGDGEITLTCSDVRGTSEVYVTLMKQSDPQIPTITSNEFDILAGRIGTLSSLVTTEKNTIVGALNEVAYFALGVNLPYTFTGTGMQGYGSVASNKKTSYWQFPLPFIVRTDAVVTVTSCKGCGYGVSGGYLDSAMTASTQLVGARGWTVAGQVVNCGRVLQLTVTKSSDMTNATARTPIFAYCTEIIATFSEPTT